MNCQDIANICQERFGDIKTEKILDYNAYIFTLEFKTSKDFIIIVKVGNSDPYNIYRYSPIDNYDWLDHIRSVLTIISISPEEDLTNLPYSPEETTYFTYTNRSSNFLGNIVNMKIKDYHKYSFTLVITTDQDYEITLFTNGCNPIFDLSEIDWDNLHEYCNVDGIDEVSHFGEITPLLKKELQKQIQKRLMENSMSLFPSMFSK